MHSLQIIIAMHTQVWSHVVPAQPADSLSVTPINHARPPSGPCPPASSLGQWGPSCRQSYRDDPLSHDLFLGSFPVPPHFRGPSIHGASVPATTTHVTRTGIIQPWCGKRVSCVRSIVTRVCVGVVLSCLSQPFHMDVFSSDFRCDFRCFGLLQPVKNFDTHTHFTLISHLFLCQSSQEQTFHLHSQVSSRVINSLREEHLTPWCPFRVRIYPVGWVYVYSRQMETE